MKAHHVLSTVLGPTYTAASKSTFVVQESTVWWWKQKSPQTNLATKALIGFLQGAMGTQNQIKVDYLEETTPKQYSE